MEYFTKLNVRHNQCEIICTPLKREESNDKLAANRRRFKPTAIGMNEMNTMGNALIKRMKIEIKQ